MNYLEMRSSAAKKLKSKHDVLNAKERNQLPKGDFAIPGANGGKGAYPIHDIVHARNALARVAQFGTPAEQALVKKAVHARYPEIGE